MKARWFVLGFTCDDVVGAGQDWRLAEQCFRAWKAAGSPADFKILEAPAGAGVHVLNWFVNDVAMRVLDQEVLGWRDRVVGSLAAPPSNASDALRRRPS
jgi:hypothetical protein